MHSSRRGFLKQAAFSALSLSLAGSHACALSEQPHSRSLRFGIIADVHKDHDADAEHRLTAFIDQACLDKPNFIIQLGDMSHGKGTREMMDIWKRFPGPGYHVLGNHEMDYATKEEIIAIQQMPGKYYSFDNNGVHFIVLDANYCLKDGIYTDYRHANYYIPYPNRDLINPKQVEWLARDLESTKLPCIIFSHEAFDENWEGSPVPNRKAVRNVIRQANSRHPGKQKVIACFCGHHHIDYYSRIDGVHYFQINSASGYSAGKSYKAPLFGFVTIDTIRQTIHLEGKTSTFNQQLTPEQLKRNTGQLSAVITSRTVSYAL